MNNELERRLRAADPTARTLVEIVVPVQDDAKVLPADWEAADSLTGLWIENGGGVRLSGSLSGFLSSSTQDSVELALPDPVLSVTSPAFWAAQVYWNGAETADLRLRRVKAYLNPRVDVGSPQTVAKWKCQCFYYEHFALTGNRIEVYDWITGDTFYAFCRLIPMGDAVTADAGAAAGVVTFDFSTQAVPLLPKRGPARADIPRPTMIVLFTPLQSDGTKANNCGIAYDSTSAFALSSGNAVGLTKLFPFVESAPSGLGFFQFLLDATHENSGSLIAYSEGIPHIEFDVDTFAAATITFDTHTGTSPGNRLAFDASPSGDVECVCKAQVPAGAAATFQLRDDAGTGWVTVTDGALFSELGLTPSQYRGCRVLLSPDAGGYATPVVYEFGMRELSRTLFDEPMAFLDGSEQWAVDPFTLKAEITEAKLTILLEGERDYRDALTEILANHNIAELEFRLFCGHPDLDRQHWLHIDTLYVDDYDPQDGAVVFTLVSALARCKQVVPIPKTLILSGISLTFDADARTITRAAGSFLDDGWAASYGFTVTGSSSNNGHLTVRSVMSATVLSVTPADTLVDETVSATLTTDVIREPYEALRGVSLKAASDDLLDNVLALPGRMRGPGIPDDTTTVAKTLNDTEAKAELDYLAYLAGGTWSTRGGRITFRDIFGAAGVVALFPSAELAFTSTVPGFRSRVPEFFVPYAYDDQKGFQGEARGFNADVIDALGEAFIDPPQSLDDEIAKWIVDGTLAESIVTRIVTTLGAGMILFHFRSIYQYPELEIGDVVAVETDRFIAKDPYAARALRGKLWAAGVIVGVHGCKGQEFTVWIRNYADITPATSTLVRRGPSGPSVGWNFTPLPGNPGQLELTLTGPLGATIYYVLQALGTAVPATGSSAYSVYTSPIVVPANASKQVSFYALQTGIVGPVVTIGPDENGIAEASVVLSEPVAGTLQLALTIDDDIRTWALYAKVGGYPTQDGTSTGVLDPAYRISREIHVEQDLGSVDETGGPLAGMMDGSGNEVAGIGGTVWRKSGYSASDHVYVIVIPKDFRGNAGPRAVADYTIAGTSSPALDAFSAAYTSDGTSCAAKATATLSWTPNGDVADGSHDLKIYRSRDGGVWDLVHTETSPASVSSYVDTLDDYKQIDGGVHYNYRWQYELVDTVATVLDSGVSNKVGLDASGTCAIP